MPYTKEEYKQIAQTKKDILSYTKSLKINTENNFKKRITLGLAPELTLASIIKKCNKKRIKAHLESFTNFEQCNELAYQEKTYSYYIDISMLAIINSYYRTGLPNQKLAAIRSSIENKYRADLPDKIDLTDLHNPIRALQQFKVILESYSNNNAHYFIDAYTIGMMTINKLKDSYGHIDNSIIQAMIQNYLEENTYYEKVKRYGKKGKPKGFQKSKSLIYEYIYE
jgi:hypothetical protein